MFTDSRRMPRYLAAQSAALALCLTYLESLKSLRASQWSGTTPREWAGLATGLLIYTLLALCLAALLAWLVDLASRQRVRPRLRASLSTLLAGCLVWAGLSVSREYRPNLDDAIVVAALLGLAVAHVAGPRLTGLSPGRFTALLLVVLLALHAALHATAHAFLFEARRAEAVTMLPPLWLALCGLAGLVAWTRPGRVAPAVYVIAALLIPPLLAPLAAGEVGATRKNTDKPNLLFIVSDTFRADHLGPETPHLQALAAEGAAFHRAYALAPWTLPSMTAMFRSAYPPGLTPGADAGAWQLELWRYTAKTEEAGLAERLRGQGYVTGAITANAFLGSIPGMLDGFDTHAKSHPILLLRQGLLSHLPLLQDALAGLCPVWDAIRPHDTTLDMDNYARAFLRRHRDHPFFLWLHYIDPHAPYASPGHAPPEDGPWPFFYPYKGGERWGIPVLGNPNWRVDEKDRPFVARLYADEVNYVDTFMGRLMAYLGQLGLEGNTIVCFTSDHGEELWEHGRWGHGQSLHEELVRVPLIFAGKGIEAAEFDAPVSAIDLFPTFAELLGVPGPGSRRGESFAAALRGEGTAPARPVFAQGTSDKARPNPYQMVVRGKHKLIRETGSGALALFDLEADPGEHHDLAGEKPELTAEMAALLDTWRATIDETFPREEDAGSGELLENLRGMGYL